MTYRRFSGIISGFWKVTAAFIRIIQEKIAHLFSWCRQPRLVTWFLFSVAAFILLRLPFMWIQIIPGHLRFNPGIALVPVVGIFFGPAGACGVFIGSLLSDVFMGQWGGLSFFRGFGVFFFALGTQQLWDVSFGHGEPDPVPNDSWVAMLKYIFVAWPGCFIDAAWRALGSELLRDYPFVYILSLVLLLNLLFCTLLGAPLYRLMAGRWAPHFGTWRDYDKTARGKSVSILTAFILFSSGITACLTGAFASRIFYHIDPFLPFVLGTSTGWFVPFVVIPFLLLQAVTTLAFYRNRSSR